MFYVGHLLKAQLSFPHHQLKNLANGTFLLNRMKQNFEGRCMEEYGYLIQILPMKAHDAKGGIKVSHIKVITEGCLALIQFDCLCFKPRKGDIIDIFIDYVDTQVAHGRFGAAEVMIPRHRMMSCDYDPKTNTYGTIICDGSRLIVDVGENVRCRCVEWMIEEEKDMKIICEIDSSVLDSRVMGRY